MCSCSSRGQIIEAVVAGCDLLSDLKCDLKHDVNVKTIVVLLIDG